MKRIVNIVESYLLEESSTAVRGRKKITLLGKIGLSLLITTVVTAGVAPYYPKVTLLALQAAGLLFAAGAAAASLLKSKGFEEIQTESRILTPTGQRVVAIERRVSREARLGIACLIFGLLVSLFAKGIDQYFTNKRAVEEQERSRKQLELAEHSLSNLQGQASMSRIQIDEIQRMITKFESVSFDVCFLLYTNDATVQELVAVLDAIAANSSPTDAEKVGYGIGRAQTTDGRELFKQVIISDAKRFQSLNRGALVNHPEVDALLDSFLGKPIQFFINKPPIDLEKFAQAPEALGIGVGLLSAAIPATVDLNYRTGSEFLYVGFNRIQAPRENWSGDGSVTSLKDLENSQVAISGGSWTQSDQPAKTRISIERATIRFDGNEFSFSLVTNINGTATDGFMFEGRLHKARRF